jgi:hypothetical protein
LLKQAAKLNGSNVTKTMTGVMTKTERQNISTDVTM